MRDFSPIAAIVVLTGMLAFDPFASLQAADASLPFAGEWKRNGLAAARFTIEGTGGRSNPLRRKLARPFAGEELFVRFRLRYDAQSIDDSEFFVLWLDEAEGGESATHSGGVPNLGIHVSEGENRFMARYQPHAERYGPVLAGDRDFLLLGRLWKSEPGEGTPFDRLDFWVDPKPGAEFSPDASVSNAKAISAVGWIGFSTGGKTEPGDRIDVWDVELATTWEGILGLPPKTQPNPDLPPKSAPAPPTVAFAEDVFPILKSRCFKCHQGDDAKDGIRLDVWDEVLNRIAPRDASASRLFELVANAEMPPEGKGEPLDAREIAVFRAWIDEGLAWDENLLPTPKPVSDHWAFRPISRPAVPEIRDETRVRTPVDAFVARRHQELGLEPAPPAEEPILRRRLTLDLTGLPPVSAKTKPDAAFVDDLLENPAYGERWGRHWLDLARWAESNGHQHNRERKHAWRYRDYVIAAFNADKPFDQFIREQIAGDEMEPASDEAIVATGFLAAARYSGNELDKDIQRNDILTDVVNTTAQTFLGLTLECAQCHTHKFDPVSIRDFYRMQAFFANAQPANVVLAGQGAGEAKSWIDERWQIFETVRARLVNVKRKQGNPEPILVIPKSVVSGMNRQEKARFAELEQKIAALPQSWSFVSPVDGRSVAPHEMRWPLPRDPAILAAQRTFLLVRGDVKSRGPEVSPGWPAIFGPSQVSGEKSRTALANWLTNPANPLTARVWVNRIWQWHFGRGLVATSGDFGLQGAKPTHPDLLDFLASELIASGWRTKYIHRLILNSATYRQSSRFSAKNAEIDPENAALWRWTPRRLEAEAVRDCILAVSGQLNRENGGPSLPVSSKRRSVYLKQQRDRLPEQQRLFDGPGGIVSCSMRRVSTTALQPLWLLNSQVSQDAAKNLAKRAGNVERAVNLAFGRDAKPDEMAALTRLTNEFGLESACLALLNSSEFLYLP